MINIKSSTTRFIVFSGLMGALALGVAQSTAALAGGTESRPDAAQQSVTSYDESVISLCEPLWAGTAEADELMCTQESSDALLAFCDATRDDYVTEGCSCGNGWYCNGTKLEYKESCWGGLACCVRQTIYCVNGCVTRHCGTADYCI
jgi:hypothetical protein